MPGPDRHEVARAFARAAAGYAKADFLHAEVRSRLLERLELVSLAPRLIADLGSGPPQATVDLARRCPEAHIIAIELAPAMLGTAAQSWDRIGADAARLPLADGSVDVVVSNMMLHWCSDPAAVLAEVCRVLRFPGLFLCSTLGPGTLAELRAAWARADRLSHTLQFTDMHNLGDALIGAGFAEPVVDTETLTVTYRDLARLVSDLRGVGAADLGPGRRRTLTGRGRWQQMTAAYETQRDDSGVLRATLEIVYAQAWSGGEAPQGIGPDGEIAVPLERLRRR